jgi:hypothetical protein
MASIEQIAEAEVVADHWLVTCSLWGPVQGEGYWWFVDVTFLDQERGVAKRVGPQCRFAFVRSRDEAIQQARDWCAGVKKKLRAMGKS